MAPQEDNYKQGGRDFLEIEIEKGDQFARRGLAFVMGVCRRDLGQPRARANGENTACTISQALAKQEGTVQWKRTDQSNNDAVKRDLFEEMEGRP